jgi:hypothetical protein
MVQLQDSILEHLHHHTISNMFSDGILEAHCVWILLCYGLGGKCLAYNLTNFYNLLIIFPNFFQNISNRGWITTSFNCKPPLMCVHTSHWAYEYPLLMLCPCQWMPGDPWCNLRHFCHRCKKCWHSHVTRTTTCTSLTHIQFFSSTSQPCVHQK